MNIEYTGFCDAWFQLVKTNSDEYNASHVHFARTLAIFFRILKKVFVF